MMRNWKLVVGGASLALLLGGCCPASLSTADQARLDENMAATESVKAAAQKAEMASEQAMQAAQKAEAAAMQAQEAADQAQRNAAVSKKAFEAGLKK